MKKKVKYDIFRRIFDISGQWLLVAILQRFEYYICLNNFSVASVYHIAFGIRSILNTYSVRLNMEDSFRTQMSFLWQLLIEDDMPLETARHPGRKYTGH